MGGIRNARMILVGKPDGKSPLRKPKHRWENMSLDRREGVE
jgi:hypothetical protein